MYASTDFAQEFFNRGVVHDMDQSEIASEMMQGAGEEAFGYGISTWGSRLWGSIFGRASLAIDASQTAAKGAMEVCKYLDRYEKWSHTIDGAEDDIESCPEQVGNKTQTSKQENDTEGSTESGATGASSANNEDDECFPPIILEQLYGNLGREEIQFNHLGHDNLASFVDVREMTHPKPSHPKLCE